MLLQSKSHCIWLVAAQFENVWNRNRICPYLIVYQHLLTIVASCEPPRCWFVACNWLGSHNFILLFCSMLSQSPDLATIDLDLNQRLHCSLKPLISLSRPLWAFICLYMVSKNVSLLRWKYNLIECRWQMHQRRAVEWHNCNITRHVINNFHTSYQPFASLKHNGDENC